MSRWSRFVRRLRAARRNSADVSRSGNDNAPRSSSSRRQAARTLQLEPLEERIELAVVDVLLGSTLDFLALATETNQVSITLSGGTFTIHDSGTLLTAGLLCTQVDPNTVTCSSAGITDINIVLGDQDDSVDLSTLSLPSSIDGGGGNDTLLGSMGDDSITGGDGNDSIVGGPGGDTIAAGAGADQLVWNDGDGSDTIDGDADTDSLTVTSSASGDNLDISANGSRVTLQRTNLTPFTLDIGSVENLDLNTGDGSDSVTVDDLSGVSDLATLDIATEAGNDALDASNLPAGILSLSADGGTGNDTLEGSGGDDTLGGGDGDDTILWNEGGGSDLIDGDGDTDTVQVTTAGGNDVLNVSDSSGRLLVERTNLTMFALDIGSTEIVQVNSGAGNDTITVGDLSGVADLSSLSVNGGLGDDQYVLTPSSVPLGVTDAGGTDTLDFSNAGSGVTVNLDLTTVQLINAAGDSLQLTGQFENFIGSLFDDTVLLRSLTVVRTVDGGGHVTADTLNYDAQGLIATDTGSSITVPGFAAVNYSNIQNVILSNQQPPARPLVFRDGVWHLRNTLSTGPADSTFAFGIATDTPVIGDWDGDGVKTVGVFRDGVFFMRNTNAFGPPDVAFAFGMAGDIPIIGDWNGDGIDTIGVVRSGLWFLRNSNTSGMGEVNFQYGIPGDIPIVGDWDGDGDDTAGVVRNGVWYLRNSNTTGGGEITFLYGFASDTPIVGDWDGDGVDTIGIIRGNGWHLRNSNTTGGADQAFSYGASTDTALVWALDPNAAPVPAAAALALDDDLLDVLAEDHVTLDS